MVFFLQRVQHGAIWARDQAAYFFPSCTCTKRQYHAHCLVCSWHWDATLRSGSGMPMKIVAKPVISSRKSLYQCLDARSRGESSTGKGQRSSHLGWSIVDLLESGTDIPPEAVAMSDDPKLPLVSSAFPAGLNSKSGFLRATGSPPTCSACSFTIHQLWYDGVLAVLCDSAWANSDP